MTDTTWTAYFTDKSGGIAKLSGDLTTLGAIEIALEAAGWRFDDVSGSWDEGSDIIASYATRGKARRINIYRESNGTFSYAEFHKSRVISVGTYYGSEKEVIQAVEGVILDAHTIDGINFHRINI